MLEFANAKILFYALNRTDSVFPLPRTTLSYMDLTYLISGEMTYFYNGERVHLHGGDAILFPPGSIREREESHTPVQYASINLRLPAGFVPLVSGHLSGCVTPTTVLQLELLAESWTLVSRYTDRQCLSLVAYLYYQLVSTVQESREPAVRQMKRYIADHLSERLTLSEIAEAVHLTPEYCCTLFRRHTGQTVFAYINEQKITMAKRLILLGERSLHEVAADMGYTEYSYFSRTFKRVTGHAPSHYKIGG